MTSTSARSKGAHSREWDDVRALIVLILICIALSALLNFQLYSFSKTQWDDGHTLTAVLASAVGLASVLTIVTGLLQWHPKFAFVCAILLFISIVTNLTSLYVSKAVVTRADIVWMWAEADRTIDVILVFGRRAVIPLLLAFGWVYLIWATANKSRHLLLRHFGERRSRTIRIASTICSFLLIIVYGFVLPVGPSETNLYAYGLYAASLSAPNEATVNFNPIVTRYRKIVVIMDESVRYDVFESEVSRYLPLQAVDLGVGLSSGNCSASSNVAMRLGIQRNSIGVIADLRANPSLWRFAKKAGYHTVLIDDQSSGKHQNFLSNQEFSQIDEFIPAQHGLKSDHDMGEALRSRMRTDTREFIYIVMRGSHFPYRGNLPPSARTTKLSRLEGYRESVAYVTGSIFEQLRASEFNQDDILLLYTSDHGQVFAGGSTHCTGEYRTDEYLVPIVVLGGGALVDDVRRAEVCNRNKVDHQELRTTALVAMGYRWEDLERHSYFPPLTQCVSNEKAVRIRSKLPWVTTRGEKLDLELWDGGLRRASTLPP